MKIHAQKKRKSVRQSQNSLLGEVLLWILALATVTSFCVPKIVEKGLQNRCRDEGSSVMAEIQKLHSCTLNSARRAVNNRNSLETEDADKDETLILNILSLNDNMEDIPEQHQVITQIGQKMLEEDNREIAMGFLPNMEECVCPWIIQSTDEGRYMVIFDWTSKLNEILQNTHLDAAELCFDGSVIYCYGGVDVKNRFERNQEKTMEAVVGSKDYTGSEYTFNDRFQLCVFTRMDALRGLAWQCGTGSGVLFLFLLAGVAMFQINEKRRRTQVAQSMETLSRQCSEMDIYTKIEYEPSDQLAPFYQIINSLTERMESLTQKNQDLADCRRNIEVRQLQGQFNPHFVFNLLANLQYLIYADQEKARQVVANSSKLLRYSISGGRINVTLETDIQHVESYLMLQQSRFGTRLEYQVQIEPELLNYRLPKLLIQPLIENAIVHNVDKVERLVIEITAKQQKEKIILAVKDNGQGIAPMRLVELNRKLEGGELEGDHIGLFNVHRTVQLEYGEGYGVQIDSVYGHGTTVMVSLPASDNRMCNEEG